MIIEELKNRSIEIIKTDDFFIGYYTTEVGVAVSRKEEKCESGIYFLKDRNGRPFPCNNDTIYVASGTEYAGKVKSNAEAEQLAKDGKIYSFKSSDLYTEYYDFEHNKELECVFKYGYSLRSRKYIETLMEKIGLKYYTDVSNGSGKPEGEPTNFNNPKTVKIYSNSETLIEKINEEWLAETEFWFAPDDFAEIKMHFNHEPSTEDLKTAFSIRKFEQRPLEIFKCRSCGRLVNWLDIDGNITEKQQYAEERYCGC